MRCQPVASPFSKWGERAEVVMIVCTRAMYLKTSRVKLTSRYYSIPALALLTVIACALHCAGMINDDTLSRCGIKKYVGTYIIILL